MERLMRPAFRELAVDENGNLVPKGKPPMPNVRHFENGKEVFPNAPTPTSSTNSVKGLTIPLITKELDQILNRAIAQGRLMTPAEVRRFEELEWERKNKEAIHNEAKVA